MPKRRVRDSSQIGLSAARTVAFDVVLSDTGFKKIQVIKEVRNHTNLGLAEAKALVESATIQQPAVLATGLNREATQSFVEMLREVGATADVQ
jgi:large subunit ribosomal protein L7/L12